MSTDAAISNDLASLKEQIASLGEALNQDRALLAKLAARCAEVEAKVAKHTEVAEKTQATILKSHSEHPQTPTAMEILERIKAVIAAPGKEPGRRNNGSSEHVNEEREG